MERSGSTGLAANSLACSIPFARLFTNRFQKSLIQGMVTFLAYRGDVREDHRKGRRSNHRLDVVNLFRSSLPALPAPGFSPDDGVTPFPISASRSRVASAENVSEPQNGTSQSSTVMMRMSTPGSMSSRE